MVRQGGRSQGLAGSTWLVVMAAMVMVAFCVTTARAQKPGGTLVYGQTGDPVTLDTAKASGLPAHFVAAQVFDHLVRLGPKGEHLPALATSWESSADLKTYSFQLRRGVKFHDGTPFTAAAVRFNYEKFRSPDKDVSAMAAQYEVIEAIETPNETTVVFRLKRPSVSFVEEQVAEWRAVMNSPVAVQKWGKQYGAHPAGTGPFKFAEWVPDDRIVLTRNADYWGGAPLLEKIVVRPIPDPQTMVLELEKGGIHLASKFEPEILPRLRQNRAIAIQRAPVLAIRGYWFNVTKPPFNDVRIRRAVSHAFNADEAIKALLGEFASPARGPVYSNSPVIHPTLKWPEYNPELAKRLLAEAGWQPTEVRILTAAGLFVKGRELSEALQQALMKVGIPAKIEELEQAAFLKKRFEKQHELIIFGTGPRSPDPSLTALDINLHSKGRLNVSGYANAELDELLQRAKSISDTSERRKLYYQAQELVVRDYVGLYTSNEVEVLALRTEVKGYQHSSIGFNNLFDKVWLD